jgi:5'-3' exonuclease
MKDYKELKYILEALELINENDVIDTLYVAQEILKAQKAQESFEDALENLVNSKDK